MPSNQTLAGLAAATLVSTTQAFADVRVERVEFVSNGETLVGDLYLPAEAAAGPVPGLVVTGAWMTVKEQQPGRYAKEMADRGFAALAFDFRGWGESGGHRRQFEDPAAKVEDIKAAARWLATRQDVRSGSIGGLAVCASAGYLVQAATETTDITSIGLVAPWMQDAGIVEQVYGGKAVVDRLAAAGDAANEAYRTTGKQTLVPAASLTDDRAIMFKMDYYTQPERGGIPAWRNEADVGFWRGWLTYDGIQYGPKLSQPMMLVHSENAAPPAGVKKFFAGVSSPKDELWLTDVTQTDFYDKPAPVTAASDAVAAHFNATLQN